MSSYLNRSAFVQSPWEFELREHTISGPKPGELLVDIVACGVCGSDTLTAKVLAKTWQNFGHEVSGIVKAIGEGVTEFAVGDRVGLDSSAPCGKCGICLPSPYGQGRPDLCGTPTTYWASETMGFSDYIITPQECAVKVPDSVSLEEACLLESLAVSTDLFETAGVQAGDNVLIIGPGPIGLGAIVLARNAGASSVVVAGLSTSVERMKSAIALGADKLIEVDKTPLKDYDFGDKKPNKILVTSPPHTIPDALKVAANGATIAFLGLGLDSGGMIDFNADDFHFRKLTLRSSFASPSVHAKKSMRLIEIAPQLGKELISHKFKLDDIADAFKMAREDNERTVKKMIMIK